MKMILLNIQIIHLTPCWGTEINLYFIVFSSPCTRTPVQNNQTKNKTTIFMLFCQEFEKKWIASLVVSCTTSLVAEALERNSIDQSKVYSAELKFNYTSDGGSLNFCDLKLLVLLVFIGMPIVMNSDGSSSLSYTSISSGFSSVTGGTSSWPVIKPCRKGIH